MAENKIENTVDAWESGELGTDEAFAKVAEDIDQNAIDDALELQLISIRLQKSLIEDMKYIAKLNGLGYQPLMRQALTRFAEGEKKRILREAYCEAKKAEKMDLEQEDQQDDDLMPKCA